MIAKDNFYRGIGWNAINSVFRVIFGILSTVVLSRLLTPEDFGIYGILLIFITLAELLADSGMAGYVVRSHSVERRDYDTLFVYNFSISVLLYIILYIAAPWIASFYNNEDLILGTRLSCVVVIFQSISIIATAKLLRTLSFKELTIISVLSSLLGLVVAIVWAYYIGGFFSLVVQSIVSVFFNSAGQLWVTRTIPHFEFDIKCFKKQFSFGINLVGSSILQSCSSNISNNIIAKLFNVNLAGVFIQSSKLQYVSTSLIQGIIDKTFFPILSKISNDIELLFNEARKISRISYAICFPVFTLVGCLAEPIIIVLLGNQWMQCTKIFQLLMLSSFPILIKIVNRNILKSLGYTIDILLIEVIPFCILLLSFTISVYLKNYMMFVIFIVICNFISSFISMIYISNRVKENVHKMLSDAFIFSPFLIISVIDLMFDNYNLIYYLVNFVLIISALFIYIILKNQEYLIIKKQLHF